MLRQDDLWEQLGFVDTINLGIVLKTGVIKSIFNASP